MQDPSGELTITGVVQREAWLQRAMPPAPTTAARSGRWPWRRNSCAAWARRRPRPPPQWAPQHSGRSSPRSRCPTGCSRTGSWPTCPAGNSAPCTPPGHTPGHLCFVDERSRRLFSGDHVLPRITPNISVQRGAPPDPLGDYLDSLARTWDLDVDEVLPAHEWQFQMRIFAVTETAAHAHLLERRGLVAASRTRPPAYTARAA